MHTNSLNLEETVRYVTQGLDSYSKPIQDWAHRIVRSHLSGPHFQTFCGNLRLPFVRCITKREFRMLNLQAEMFAGGSFFGVPNRPKNEQFCILEPEDYQQNSWLYQALEHGDDIIHFGQIEYREGVRCPRYGLAERNTFISHLMDSLQAMLPGRDSYASITLDRAYEYSIEWQKQLDHEAKTVEGLIQDTGFQFETEDGPIKIVSLLDQQACRREGYLMRHCVGSYIPNLRLHIYSLRHAETNESVVTAEVQIKNDSVTVVQVQGESNSVPPESYRKGFTEFATAKWGDKLVQLIYIDQSGLRLDQRGDVTFLPAVQGEPLHLDVNIQPIQPVGSIPLLLDASGRGIGPGNQVENWVFQAQASVGRAVQPQTTLDPHFMNLIMEEMQKRGFTK